MHGERCKRALIVWGGWAGHEPEAGAGIVAGMLRDDETRGE